MTMIQSVKLEDNQALIHGVITEPKLIPHSVTPISVTPIQEYPPAPRAIFDLIVKDDADLTGLLAYSYHELSRREWHVQFVAQGGREPTMDEKRAFMIGEETERRTGVYRRLADDALTQREQGKSSSIFRPKSSNMPQNLIASNDTQMMLASNSKSNGVMSLSDGAKAALRLPKDTSLRALGRYLVILSVLVFLLAVAVNYAKSTLFG